MNLIEFEQGQEILETIKQWEVKIEECRARCRELDEQTLIFCGGYSLSRDNGTLTPDEEKSILDAIHYAQSKDRDERWMIEQAQQSIRELTADYMRLVRGEK